MKILAVFFVVGVALSTGQKKTTCNCGWRREPGRRIVGGVESGVNEWPSIAALVEVDKNMRGGQTCGSTIISKKHVLTAAHCVRSRDEKTNQIVDTRPENLRVVVAAHDWTKSQLSDFLEVENVMIHENYDDRVLANDIALIAVKGNIKFSEIVGPACFPNKRLNLENQPVTAVGWGATWMNVDVKGKGNPIQTSILHKVDLTAYNVQSCRRHYPNLFDVRNVHQLCTYNPGRSICPGDSGGPLYWLDPEINRYVIAGVTSFVPGFRPLQPGCQDLSGFTDPSAFIDWIGARLGRESVCFKV